MNMQDEITARFFTPDKVSILITELGRPSTVNGERRLHRMARANLTKKWRLGSKPLWEAKLEGKTIKTPVMVEVVPLQKDKRWTTDVGAIYPSLKAVVDGLVDTGAIPDDNPEFLTKAIMHGPYICGMDGLLVAVYPTSEEG